MVSPPARQRCTAALDRRRNSCDLSAARQRLMFPAIPPFRLAPFHRHRRKDFFERLKNTVANSAVGHSMESTLPKLTDALDMHPTETVNSPTYASDKDQVVAPQFLVPPTDHSKAANITTGVLKGVGGLTSGQSMSTMVAAAATAGLAAPAIPVVGRLVALGFSLQTAKDLVHQAPQLIDANHRGDSTGFYQHSDGWASILRCSPGWRNMLPQAARRERLHLRKVRSLP